MYVKRQGKIYVSSSEPSATCFIQTSPKKFQSYAEQNSMMFDFGAVADSDRVFYALCVAETCAKQLSMLRIQDSLQIVDLFLNFVPWA